MTAALSVLAALSVATPALAVQRKGTTLAKAPVLEEAGHLAFWQCPATTTELQVVVNTLTLHPGSTLEISFTVHNEGTAPCRYTAPYAGPAPGPTTTALRAGPCGSVGYEVENAQHHNVWPGTTVVNCPALGTAELAAGATVTGAGSWNQSAPNGAHRLPPGHYTLTVGNKHFSFPLRIVG